MLELENRVEQLVAENRALQEAHIKAEQNLKSKNSATLAERDSRFEQLKASLAFLQNEVSRLTEVNEGLNSANKEFVLQHDERYKRLEAQHATAARDLEVSRANSTRVQSALEDKDREIAELRAELDKAKLQIRELQEQILAANRVSDTQFLKLKDVDYFDSRCQKLCSHLQQWVLRFSKFSDMRHCRLTSEINDEKLIDRLDNSVLDGTDVDEYLSDRVRRRDIFMSLAMTMIWEFVFTRYLFGMDREQRQKIKSLEKTLLEIGPLHAVRQWRAVTLTLLTKRPSLRAQRDQDTEAVVQAIFQALSLVLPPPSNLEEQIQTQLRRVVREAVDLSIEMRTQRSEYMMLSPYQPEYDANGELAQFVTFNASFMNERSGDASLPDCDALEARNATVRIALFPLVVKKGDDDGIGEEEIVVCPAQVLIAAAHRARSRSRTPSKGRRGTPGSEVGGVSLEDHSGTSNMSMTSLGGGAAVPSSDTNAEDV